MEKNQEVRKVFVRDNNKTVTGIASHEEARELADKIPETDTQRVRVRFRNRTNLWDVVVKTLQELKPAKSKEKAKFDGADSQLPGESG